MIGRIVGGKENPHRHGAHRYKPMGVPLGRMVLGEHHTHHIGSPMQAQCQEKAPTGQSSSQGQWGLL